MSDLVSLIQQIVRAEIRKHSPSAFGIVETVHTPDAAGTVQYACDVRLQGSAAIYRQVPLCTGYLGHVAPPVVGDVVVLSFIGGDPDQPIIAGLVFSDAVQAPQVAQGQMLTRLPHDGADDARIDTAQSAGTNGARAWQVTLPSGPVLSLTDTAVTAALDGMTLALDAEAGEAKLMTGGAVLTLTGQGDITLRGDGALTLEAGSDLTLKAGGRAVLDAGGGAELAAAGTMDVKGATINLN